MLHKKTTPVKKLFFYNKNTAFLCKKAAFLRKNTAFLRKKTALFLIYNFKQSSWKIETTKDRYQHFALLTTM